MTLRTAALLLTLASITHLAAAHGNEEHKKAMPVKMEQKPWGIAGDPKAVSRTIEIGMTDAMRFTPDQLEVRLGETIRFVHTNSGKVMHEFVLGTKQELEEHAALMKKFPGMEHDEPYMSHVAPGKRGEVVWRFNRAGEFDFACLLPGHYEAGMIGKIKVVAK
jgi:uncharacterized cupredoxin-like copper-binding protein